MKQNMLILQIWATLQQKDIFFHSEIFFQVHLRF